MPVAISNDKKLQARALYISGHEPQQIAQELGLKAGTISAWAYRAKWLEDRQIVCKQANLAVQAVVQASLTERGNRVKNTLAEVIERQAALLADAPPLSADSLRNNPGQQGLAATAKTVIDSASAVFGWDAERPTGILLIGQLRQFDDPKPEAQAIEVQSSPAQPV